MKCMRRWLSVITLAALLQGCATGHLIEWSKGEPSAFQQPAPSKSLYIRPGATFLAFPVAVAWDVVTFPFQWLWDIYPFGEDNAPESHEGN